MPVSVKYPWCLFKADPLWLLLGKVGCKVHPQEGPQIRRQSQQAILFSHMLELVESGFLCCPSTSCFKGLHTLPSTPRHFNGLPHTADQPFLCPFCRHRWPLSTLRMGCHTMQLHTVLLPMKAPWSICFARETTQRRMHRYVLRHALFLLFLRVQHRFMNAAGYRVMVVRFHAWHCAC